MAALHGASADISVPDADGGAVDQTGFDIYHLVNTPGANQRWTISNPQEAFAYKKFGGTVGEATAGLYGWSATLGAVFPKGGAQEGAGAGSITYSSGYTAIVNSYTLNIAWDFAEATGFGVAYRTFVPGLPSWSGSYAGIVDDTTAIKIGTTLPDAAGSQGNSATFRIADEDTDSTLAGSILLTGVDVAADIEALTTVNHSFQGSGTLTVAGTTGLLDGNLSGPSDEAELLIEADSNRTFTGRGFLTALSVQVALGQLVGIDATIQGTGTLTPA